MERKPGIVWPRWGGSISAPSWPIWSSTSCCTSTTAPGKTISTRWTISRTSIWTRSLAEKDPKIEYKREGFRMFNEMLESIDDRVTDIIFRVRLEAGAGRGTSGG